MADQLEQVISNLLVPDNDVISQATLQLKELMKNPAVVPVMCQLFSSAKPEVRQYAAVLLRKKVTKKKQWNAVASEVRENIKENIFETLIGEPDQKVRKSLVQLIATICKHELPEGKWPKVFTVFTTLAEKEDLSLRETGMFLMSSIASTAHEELKPHFQGFIHLCGVALLESRNHGLQFHAMRALYHILSSIDATHSQTLHAPIENAFAALKNLIAADEDLAVEALELFEGLVTCEVPVINPFLKNAITFFVEIGKNQELKSSLRKAALSILCEMMENKKKLVLKMNIMPALISELFAILCEQDEEEDEDEDTVSSMASQVFSLMALYLPPEKFIPPLMKLIEPAFENADPKIRTGAFVAIAVSTEGCSENIKHKHMKKLLKVIYKGMSDENDKVRSASMFALAEFSEYLQPDINKYSQELLPLLFECLSKISTDENAEKVDLVRIFYAIEKFCENLGKDILPYLPQLMEFLISSARNSPSYDVKELSISTIGAAAESADEEIMPYLPHILELLKSFLQPTTEEGPLKVQVQSLTALSTLLRKSGEKNEALVTESFGMALNLIDNSDDPELRGAIYRIFGTCWIILKDKLAVHVPDVCRMLIGCMKSNEGISATFHDDDAKHISEIFDDEEEEEDLEDEDEEMDSLLGNNVSISLQNSYMSEKVDAIIALGEVASGSGVAFLPFFEESFKECLDLLIYPDTSIISSAASCATDLCCSAFNLAKTSPEQHANVTSGLTMMLNATVPKLLEVIKEEEEREIVISILECLNKLISTIGAPVIQAATSVNVLFNLIKDAIKRKLKCQDEVDEDDEDEAEYDTLLIDNAGELIPTLAGISPSNEFVAFYSTMIPELMKKLKPSSTIADRSFAIGNMAETMHKLGKPGAVFAMKIYPVMKTGVKDEDEEVRNNSIYGLGVLAEIGGSPILNHYIEILKLLSDALAKETDRRVIDNICGAVCRMITTSPASVPVGEVLSSIMSYLPLQVDLEENPTVFQCFASLYSQKHQDVFQLLPKILVIAAALLSAKAKPEFKTQLLGFVQEVSRNNPEAFSSVTDEQALQVLQCSLQNGIN